MITGNSNLYYLIAMLNSNLYNFYYQFISSQLGASAVRLFTQFVETIPIKKISEKEEKIFTEIVKEILEKKIENPEVDTEELERKIDEMVYKLYGLTEEEITLIEGKE